MEGYQKNNKKNKAVDPANQTVAPLTQIRTDLEWRVVTGDFHGELVGDGGSVVLQGDQADVSQAGSV